MRVGVVVVQHATHAHPSQLNLRLCCSIGAINFFPEPHEGVGRVWGAGGRLALGLPQCACTSTWWLEYGAGELVWCNTAVRGTHRDAWSSVGGCVGGSPACITGASGPACLAKALV